MSIYGFVQFMCLHIPILLGSYYMYCFDFWWIILFIFITALLLYVLFRKKVDCTVHFYYCTALPIIRTVLKKQACNIYKYWSYNRNIRVHISLDMKISVILKCTKTLWFLDNFKEKLVIVISNRHALPKTETASKAKKP